MLDLFKFSIKRVFLLSLFFLFIFSSLVFAVQPTIQQNGLINIIYPKNLEFTPSFTFWFDTLNNDSIKLSNVNISCTYVGVDTSGIVEFEGFAVYNSIYEAWMFNVSDSTLGVKNTYIYCNDSYFGSVSLPIIITPNGLAGGFDSLFKYLIVVALGLVMFVVGMSLKSYTPTILGGFILFLGGLWILLEPMAGLNSWVNYIVGAALFGFGAYIWIVVSIEESDM